MSDDPSAPESAPPRSSCPAELLVRFLVDAEASPGLLSRLLQPYAKRDLVPDRMWSHRSGAMMHVEIAMEAMPAETVALVEGNLRQVVGVHSVARVTRAPVRAPDIAPEVLRQVA